MITSPSRVLLFDLGGVLIEFAGLKGFTSLLRTPVPEAEILQRWIHYDLLIEFEMGLLTPAQFAERLAQEWDLSVTPAQFLVEWESWTRQLYPGARELLDELRPGYRLAALSNSNVLHWNRNVKELGIMTLFERAFSSHELGIRKPAREIYEHTVRELGVRPEQIIFFDDTAANVEAAQAVGMQAHRVRGLEALRSCMVEIGLLKQ